VPEVATLAADARRTRRHGDYHKGRYLPLPAMTPPAVTATPTAPLADGLILFVKRECETCALITPLIDALGIDALFVQDDPAAFAAFGPVDDTALEHSYCHAIETVPALIRMEGGREAARAGLDARSRRSRLSGCAGG
jgi:hypothetical protein